MESTFRITDIEVNNASNDEHIVGLFRYESANKGRKTPLLVVIVEISSMLYVYEQLLDVLNETAEQTRHLTSAVDADPMARFEKLVERLNTAIESFVEREPSEIAWNRVNIYVMEFLDGHMCVSGIGCLSNILLQKQPDGTLKSFDLFGSLEQPPEVNPKKVFSSVLCGELKMGDLLFVGTNNFDHWRTDLDLINRIKNLPPVTASMEVRQEIERIGIPEDFAGVIVNHVKAPNSAPPTIHEKLAHQTEAKSTESVQKLYSQEKQTEALLSASIKPVVKSESTHDKLPQKKQASSFSFVKLLAEFRNYTKNLRSKVKDPISMTSLRGMDAGHGSFFSAKKKRMVLLGLIAVIAVASLGGWSYLSRKAKAEQELWNAVYDQVVDRKNRAEADLVYGNEDQTRRLVKEAQDLLAGLDEKTDTQKTSKETLINDLNDVQNKLRREQRVDNPTLLASLAIDAPENSLNGLVLANGRLYAADNAAKQLLEVDPISKQVQRYDIPSTVNGSIIAASETATGPVFLTNDKKILRLSGAKVTVLSYNPESTENPKDINVYNKRFYILDSSGNMIWRHSVTGNSVGAGSQYLKQNSENLSNAVGIAIDASVYIAFSNGTLKRYLSGTEEQWNPATIDPALTHADSIWTNLDTDRVAIADADGKRVVIFRKDARLVSQIISNEFKGPRFVTGDSANKKLYIIDGNRLYQLDLP